MTTYPNDPAFDTRLMRPGEREQYSFEKFQECLGLTRREYFAAAAMTLLLRSSVHEIVFNEARARECVAMADALIAELNKKPKGSAK